ncbi:hypothetical protein ACFLWA_05780 [Chloroflexota bacterium]
MLELINDRVSVEVRTRRDGRAIPMAFVWQGARFRVESWGRESGETEEGRAVRCHLVQTAGGDSWELCQDVETAQWTLTRHWAAKFRAI